jgi:hypothetical protein
MRQLGAVIATGTLLVLAAGCAGHSTAQPGGAQQSPSPTTTSQPGATGPAMGGIRLPVGAEPVPGNQVDAHSLPATFPRELWTEQGGTVLGFYGEVGGCTTEAANVTSQTATQVLIRLIQDEPGTGSQVCPMYLRYKTMSVQLAAPLGTRTVVLELSVMHT